MYEQSLVKTVEPVKKTTISRLNKGKKWKYGYDKEHDIIVLSHSGQIGEIIEIQGLVIALPKAPKEVYKDPKNKWVKFEYPKELQRIKNIFDWRNYPESSKEKWYDYIDEEFRRREEGFWFTNNGKPTWITGTQYMYLQWSKIDVGAQILERQTDCFIYSGKLVKQIKDVMECVILKIDVLVFLLCHQQKQLTLLLLRVIVDLVYYLKLVQMLRKCLPTK